MEKFLPIIAKTLPSKSPKIPLEMMFSFVLQALRIVINKDNNEKSKHKTRYIVMNIWKPRWLCEYLIYFLPILLFFYPVSHTEIC